MGKFIIDWSSTNIFFKRLELACKKAHASGHDVGIQGRYLKCFPMGDQFHEDGFDCLEADMILPKERFSTFLSQTWFSFKEAKDQGLAVLLDCETGSISPIGNETTDDASVIEQFARPLYETELG